MPYALHNLRPAHGSKHSSRRLGRGHGTGRGKTSGRGTKGQKARAGGRGGLKRLGMRRMLLQQPKLRGFRSLQPKPAIVNLIDIEKTFTAGAIISAVELTKHGLIRSTRDGVKILGGGQLTKALTFKGLEVSESAKTKIEAAGGRIEIKGRKSKDVSPATLEPVVS